MKKSLFYGKRKRTGDIDWSERLARREKSHQETVVPSLYRPRLLGPNHAWKIFYRQKDAFQFARENEQDLHVFSFESESFQSNSGQRSFLVTSYEEFWHYYSQLLSHQRHHYELIPEASVCHLYFDLEFPRSTNPDLNGAVVTQCFVRYVCAMIHKLYNIRCDDKHVLQLDASTESKFSRHLIFHLPGAAFKDNIHAGNFVKHIMTALLYNVNSRSNELTLEEESSSADDMNLSNDVIKLWDLRIEDLRKMVVKNKNNKDTLFCDIAVYTKNRNFRLYLSSKLGKSNPLILAPENQYKPNTIQTHKKSSFKSPFKERKLSEQETVFLSSLVANVKFDENIRILQFQSDSQKRKNYPLAELTDNTSSVLSSFDSSSDSAQSPFPEVDAFILTLVNRENLRGRIRRWTYFTQGNLVLYDIAENRWCENIGRQHKSNNVMMVADLKHGVYYQKCHDPDCRALQYKSPDRAIPQEILNIYNCKDNWEDEAESSPIAGTCASFDNFESSQSILNNATENTEISDNELLRLVHYQESNSDLTNSCDTRREPVKAISRPPFDSIFNSSGGNQSALHKNEQVSEKNETNQCDLSESEWSDGELLNATLELENSF